jgi:thioesterase-3
MNKIPFIKDTEIKVRGFHLDLYQHVNNARYLEFLEQARWDFFDQLGVSEQSVRHALAFIIYNINIDFIYPAIMNDQLVIKTVISEIRKSKMILQQRITLKDNSKSIATATVSLILKDQKNNKLVSIEQHFPQLIDQTK